MQIDNNLIYKAYCDVEYVSSVARYSDWFGRQLAFDSIPYNYMKSPHSFERAVLYAHILRMFLGSFAYSPHRPVFSDELNSSRENPFLTRYDVFFKGLLNDKHLELAMDLLSDKDLLIDYCSFWGSSGVDFGEFAKVLKSVKTVNDKVLPAVLKKHRANFENEISDFTIKRLQTLEFLDALLPSIVKSLENAYYPLKERILERNRETITEVRERLLDFQPVVTNEQQLEDLLNELKKRTHKRV